MKCVICGKEINESLFSNAVLCSRECFNDLYWSERVKDINNKNQVIIDNQLYYIEPENDPSQFRGFGGQRFEIAFFDGRTVVTTNLWHNGTVPEKYRDILKNNAKFV